MSVLENLDRGCVFGEFVVVNGAKLPNTGSMPEWI